MTLSAYVAEILPFDEPDGWSLADLQVAPSTVPDAVQFIAEHHYSGGGGGNCITTGLYRGMRLVGVAAFGVPVSGDAASSVFGEEHQHRVMDLQRLVLVDDAPKNTESWFIVRALRDLKRRRPETWAVTSFADSTQGHVGTIYQATNAVYGGLGPSRIQFLDRTGRLRSDRLDGRKVTVEAAAEYGWTPVRRAGKHRYLFLTADGPAHRRTLIRSLRWTPMAYPKAAA